MPKRSFLDEAIHQATLKERERITKLLKEYWTDSTHTWIPIHKALAFVKGKAE